MTHLFEETLHEAALLPHDEDRMRGKLNAVVKAAFNQGCAAGLNRAYLLVARIRPVPLEALSAIEDGIQGETATPSKRLSGIPLTLQQPEERNGIPSC